jgi:hypothetical protein
MTMSEGVVVHPAWTRAGPLPGSHNHDLDLHLRVVEPGLNRRLPVTISVIGA